MLYVLKALAEQLQHVIVVDGVEYLLAVAAELYEAGTAEDAELMGDGGLTHVQAVCDIVDAQFLCGCKEGENLDAGRVTEGLEEVGEVLCCILVDTFHRSGSHALRYPFLLVNKSC